VIYKMAELYERFYNAITLTGLEFFPTLADFSAPPPVPSSFETDLEAGSLREGEADREASPHRSPEIVEGSPPRIDVEMAVGEEFMFSVLTGVQHQPPGPPGTRSSGSARWFGPGQEPPEGTFSVRDGAFQHVVPLPGGTLVAGARPQPGVRRSPRLVPFASDDPLGFNSLPYTIKRDLMDDAFYGDRILKIAYAGTSLAQYPNSALAALIPPGHWSEGRNDHFRGTVVEALLYRASPPARRAFLLHLGHPFAGPPNGLEVAVRFTAP
jgi:hypothetical protein